MNTALVTTVISLIEEAIKIEPQLAASIKSLFASGAPTAADFDAERATVAAMEDPIQP